MTNGQHREAYHREFCGLVSIFHDGCLEGKRSGCGYKYGWESEAGKRTREGNEWNIAAWAYWTYFMFGVRVTAKVGLPGLSAPRRPCCVRSPSSFNPRIPLVLHA